MFPQPPYIFIIAIFLPVGYNIHVASIYADQPITPSDYIYSLWDTYCSYTVKIEVLPSTPFRLTNCKVSGSTNRGANLNPIGVLKVTGC